MSEAFLARFMCPYSRMGVKSDSLKEREQLTNRRGGKGRLAWIFSFLFLCSQNPLRLFTLGLKISFYRHFPSLSFCSSCKRWSTACVWKADMAKAKPPEIDDKHFP